MTVSRPITEFGAALQAFIGLPSSRFKNQSEFAAAAGVADSTVTRTTSNVSFSPTLLAKLIRPFDAAKQVELVRAYLRDRLREAQLEEGLVAAALGGSEDSLARFKPEIRLLALSVAASAADDEQFRRTLDALMDLVGADRGARVSRRDHPSKQVADQLLSSPTARRPSR